MVNSINTIIVGFIVTGVVHQVGTINLQTTVVLMVTLNVDTIIGSNVRKYLINDVIHSLNIISCRANIAGIVYATIIVAAHQNAEGTCIFLLDLRGNVGHGGAGVAGLIVRGSNDDDGITFRRKCGDGNDANQHHQSHQ